MLIGAEAGSSLPSWFGRRVHEFVMRCLWPTPCNGPSSGVNTMRSHTKWLIIGATVLALAGCGGAGGGGAGAGAPGAPGGGTQSLSGTAAVGAPLPQAEVTLTGANGVSLNAQANEMGQFTFPDVSTLTAPLMLRATGTAGGRQHILFSASMTLVPTLNVTPLTTAVVEMVLPGEGTAGSVFNSFSVNNAQQLADLNAAKTRVIEALSAVLTSLQLPANTNPFTTPFVADGRGLDRLLDLIDFFESEANELLIIEKSDRTNVATVGSTGPVTPLPAPSAARLDTSGIRTLIDNLNALTDPLGKVDLIDVDFMHSGESKAVFLAESAGSCWASPTGRSTAAVP